MVPEQRFVSLVSSNPACMRLQQALKRHDLPPPKLTEFRSSSFADCNFAAEPGKLLDDGIDLGCVVEVVMTGVDMVVVVVVVVIGVGGFRATSKRLLERTLGAET